MISEATNTNPPFWREWRQLGHAVVLRAVYDYAKARKKAVRDRCGFYYANELGYYEKFFCSQYFAHICPDYDGHKLLEILEGGKWQHLPKLHRVTPPPTYIVWEYQPKEKPDPLGRGRKRKYG